MREACSDEPVTCFPYLDNLAAEEGVKSYYVSFPLDPSTSVSWAEQYSSLSVTHKEMVEIGFDDFIGQIEDDQIAGTLPNPTTFMEDVLAATKSENSNLAFGVTVYEDYLNHTALTSLPSSVRGGISYVHLYLHYREDAPNWATYVATAKSLFPNAKIIAGAYPYDRINYLPCAYKGTVECTAAQEQSYYQEVLTTQANMLKAGTVYGLEFFFGYFGNPQDWPSWTTQKNACLSSRLSQCYSNTTILQNISLQVLKATFAASSSSSSSGGTAKVSLSHTSVYMGQEYENKQSTPATVTLTNTGSGSLSVSSISAGGADGSMFPLSNNCGTTVPVGGACTLTIYFKPTAVGACSGSVVISDSVGTQTIALTGTALPPQGGTPAVSLTHTSVYMGSEYVGTKSTPAKVVLTNTGSGTLSISSIVVAGVNGSNFPISNNCGSSAVAGASCTLTIYLQPTATGTRSGEVIIYDNAGSGSQTITLTGTGLANP
jgi:archaellum component FlaF (FlaF/FlaG flagellin family)